MTSFFDFDGRQLPKVDHYLANTGVYRPRFRFPSTARRYTDLQYATLVRSPRLLNTVLLGKYGLVQSNFGLAELVNDGQPRFVQTIRYSDLTKADIRAFIREMRKTALLNKWLDDMLEVELQFLLPRRAN
jgi:hypothetical protein